MLKHILNIIFKDEDIKYNRQRKELDKKVSQLYSWLEDRGYIKYPPNKYMIDLADLWLKDFGIKYDSTLYGYKVLTLSGNDYYANKIIDYNININLLKRWVVKHENEYFQI